MIEKDVITDFSPAVSEPVIGSSTFVHPLAAVIGGVILGNNVMVSPGASVRGDEGQPLFVGNDSGPMHIAALAGVPTLGLLGPNFPHISGPLGSQSWYIFHKFPCSGCNQRGCDFSYRCINAITMDEVMGVLKEMTGLT